MGNIENGERSGYGIHFRNDGSIIEGIWNEDSLEKTYRIVYANGDIYEGDLNK